MCLKNFWKEYMCICWSVILLTFVTRKDHSRRFIQGNNSNLFQQIRIVQIDDSHTFHETEPKQEELVKLLKLKFTIRTGSGTRGKSYGIKNHLLAKCRACVRGKIFKRGSTRTCLVHANPGYHSFPLEFKCEEYLNAANHYSWFVLKLSGKLGSSTEKPGINNSTSPDRKCFRSSNVDASDVEKLIINYKFVISNPTLGT